MKKYLGDCGAFCEIPGSGTRGIIEKGGDYTCSLGKDDCAIVTIYKGIIAASDAAFTILPFRASGPFKEIIEKSKKQGNENLSRAMQEAV